MTVPTRPPAPPAPPKPPSPLAAGAQVLGGQVLPARLTDQVFTRLRDGILAGELEPGRRLRIRELALALGTSEMPVREAVARLAEAGLVLHRPHRGAVVASLSIDELDECYGVRIILEAEAARSGALRIAAREVARMERLLAALQEAAAQNEIAEALKLDEEFLGTLYDAAGNGFLLTLIRSIWDRVQPYKVLWASTAERRGWTALWRYKPKLLAAARAHDGALAAALTVESLEAARAELARLIAAREEEHGPRAAVAL